MLKARQAWQWNLNFAGSARVAQQTFDIDMLADAIRGACNMSQPVRFRRVDA